MKALAERLLWLALWCTLRDSALSPMGRTDVVAAFTSHPKIGRSCYEAHHGGTSCRMGWWDTTSDFFQQRSGDFTKLDIASNQAFGPGPLLLLYNVPVTMDDAEFRDMLDDALPPQVSSRCTLFRIQGGIGNNGGSDQATDATSSLLNLPLAEALNEMMKQPSAIPYSVGLTQPSFPTDAIVRQQDSVVIPVLYFSGFTNADMMAVYNVVAPEIWAEVTSSPTEMSIMRPAACAKAVGPAMSKPLRQVLDEIASDHVDALSQSNE